MIRKTIHKVKTDNENGARKAIIEDLFYDFHKNRREVYLTNFIRGVFFGVGSVLGGTVVIAIIIWVLNLFVDLPGGFGQFIQFIVDSVQRHSIK